MIVAFPKPQLQALIDALLRRNYQVVGPRLGEGAVVLGPVTTTEELPRGWTEEQEAGRYRLLRDDRNRYFGFSNGPHSAKNSLHPPNLCLWKSLKSADGFTVEVNDDPPKTAFLGLRACDLAAVRVQDNVFLGQEHRDPWYGTRRDSAFLIGVNCAQAGGTCFCASMKTGPEIRGSDDLTLTELDDLFLAEARTELAREILEELETRPAEPEELERARTQIEQTEQQMGRTMPEVGVPELLKRNLNHPRWQDVADRCLTCGNCTMVCPTCFCSTVEDFTDLKGEVASRERSWDSCFTQDFTLTSGVSHRSSNLSRYRQWLTHKLSTWHDQFGESGCVGCGRCITWCPVAIDITEEVAAIAATDGEFGG
jgi:ferredoxin